MARNTIKIDGDKLRKTLETTTGLTIYQICESNGYSRNLLAEAIRKGQASPVVQTLLKLYGITPEAYKVKEETSKAPEQMSIDDITPLNRDELKELVKESVIEVFNSLTWKIDPKTNTVTFLVGNKEVI